MKKYLFFSLIFFAVYNLYAQTDTLIFKNGNVVAGEIKNMSRGVIQIETDYSDSDFLIEWEKVTELYSQQMYIISLNNGERLKSKINTDSTDNSKLILNWDGTEQRVNKNDVVYIKPLEDRIRDRLAASIDLGFSLTKVNNLRQLTTRSYMGYFTDKWSADASLDAVRSSQDSIANTKRTDVSISFNYFLGKNWFVLVSSKFLQNDEQKLKLRTTPKTGIGNFIFQTNEMYLSIYAGAALNYETYTDNKIQDRQDVEANAGAELNLFDMGDLGLLTSLSVYKSMNEGDRLRIDFKFDIKYDLPLDFYIKVGYTLNYDSQPVEDASDKDYIIQSTFGWEL